jgi:hypothetical protein
LTEMSTKITAELDGYTLRDNRLYISCPSIEPFKAKKSNSDLRVLQKFPAEIIDSILSELDLQSIVRFRGVNAGARCFVDEHRHYSKIFKLVPDVLRAFHQTNLAAWVTCKHLFDTLHSCSCEACGKNGVYLYLFTCTRVCRLCFATKDQFLPMQPKPAQFKYALNRKILHGLPRIRVRAGRYGPRMVLRGGHYFHDSAEVKRAGIVRHGSEEAMKKRVAKNKAAREKAYDTRYAKAVIRGECAPTQHIEPSDTRASNWRRYLAITRIPWVCRGTNVVYHGFYCDGCKHKVSRTAYFTKESHDDHMAKKGKVVKGRHRPSLVES